MHRTRSLPNLAIQTNLRRQLMNAKYLRLAIAGAAVKAMMDKAEGDTK